MPFDGALILIALQVPETQIVIIRCRDGALTIRGDDNGIDKTSGPLKVRLHLPVFRSQRRKVLSDAEMARLPSGLTVTL